MKTRQLKQQVIRQLSVAIKNTDYEAVRYLTELLQTIKIFPVFIKTKYK